MRLARVLGPANFINEPRAHLLGAALCLTRALAVENRLPEPGELSDALLPPLSLCCKESLPILRAFTADTSSPWEPVAESLSRV